MVHRCGRRPLVPLNDPTNSPNKVIKFSDLESNKAKSETPRRRSSRLSTSEGSDGTQHFQPTHLKRLRRLNGTSLLHSSQMTSTLLRRSSRRKRATPKSQNKAINICEIDDEKRPAEAKRTTESKRQTSSRKAKELAVCRMLQRNFKLTNSAMIDRWRSEIFVHEKEPPCVHLTEGDVFTKRKDDSPDSAYSSSVSSFSRSSRSADGTPPLPLSVDEDAPGSSRQGLAAEKESKAVKHAAATCGRERVPAKRSKKTDGKRGGVSYQGIRRMEYKDLFCDILPFVKPTYTPLSDPPMPNLIGVDTSKRWLSNLSEKRLNEFVDVGDKEKDFFGLWNSFTMRRENRPVGCAGLPYLLERFVDEFGAEMVKRGLLFNFVSHCVCLCRSGFLSQDQMFEAMELMEKLDFQPFIPSRREVRRSPQRRSPQQSPSKNKRADVIGIRSLSNFFRML